VTRDEYARLKDIVAAALARPDVERSAYVAARCGNDPATRVEVESLLAAAVRAALLYEDPTLLVQGVCVTFEAFDDVEATALPFVPPPPRPLLTATLRNDFEGTERYAVRRRIGAGGMNSIRSPLPAPANTTRRLRIRR
jgi:hypothetical protein